MFLSLNRLPQRHSEAFLIFEKVAKILALRDPAVRVRAPDLGKPPIGTSPRICDNAGALSPIRCLPNPNWRWYH
jgi:hypothetical protein